MSMMPQPPSLPASPELPESVREAIETGLENSEIVESNETHAQIATNILKELAPLWPRADGSPSPVAGLPTPEEDERREMLRTLRNYSKMMEDLHAQIEEYGCPNSASGAIGDKINALVANLRAETAAAKEEVEQTQELLNACKAAVVGTVQGTVEGEPTHGGNYLQRLRQLVATENALKGAIGASTKAILEADDLRAQFATAKEELERANRPWSVQLSWPQNADPFGNLECRVIDVGHADRVLVVECPRASSDLAKANAAVEVLSTARTAIERSLEGAASFDGYYRHHRNAIAMMDKLGVKPIKENNDHGF